MTTSTATAGAAVPSRALAAVRFARERIARTTFATGPSEAPGVSNRPAEDSDPSSRLMKVIGGKRGIVDGGLPPLVFAVVNAIVTTRASRPTALAASIGAALGTGAALVVLRLIRKEAPKQALRGLAGLAVAVIFALRSGEARAFFLPGIYIDAAYAIGFAVSALVGRPLIAIVYSWLYRDRERWSRDERLRRAFVVATLGWSALYASRVVVQAVLYQADRPGIMAASKIFMGWPLTILAVLVTLAYVRRVSANTTEA
jgi:hypothetical protein